MLQDKVVSIITYINIRRKELHVEISGEIDVFESMDIIREIAACAPEPTHQIIASSSAHRNTKVMCVRYMYIVESVFLCKGIETIKKYIDKISPQKVSINFCDFSNKNFPDFVIVVNHTARPAVNIEISSLVGCSRFYTKGIGIEAFGCIRKFYANNISLHT